jgi:paraquat-inducible protein B
MSSPTKSFSNILKSKMVSSPVSSSPVSPSPVSSSPVSSSLQQETIYLREQLEDCRRRLRSEPSKRLISEIEKSYQRLVQICSDQRSYIDLLNDQVFELAGALTKRYDTTLQELERCGVIISPKINPPQLTTQESDAMKDLDNLLQELQTSLTLSSDSSKASSESFSDLSSI